MGLHILHITGLGSFRCYGLWRVICYLFPPIPPNLLSVSSIYFFKSSPSAVFLIFFHSHLPVVSACFHVHATLLFSLRRDVQWLQLCDLVLQSKLINISSTGNNSTWSVFQTKIIIVQGYYQIVSQLPSILMKGSDLKQKYYSVWNMDRGMWWDSK